MVVIRGGQRHRLLLLKLDKQTHSNLLVEFCIQQGIPMYCIQYGTPPLQALCVARWKKWPVDEATDLFD